MSKKNIFLLIIVILILGALAVVVFQKKSTPVSSTKYDVFAQCIASKNLTMYGASWCPHCKDEKSKFGDSFKYVPYVECTEKPDVCLAKGVQGYPTWIASDGTKYVGEQGLEGLAKITGCVLPTN